MERGGISYGCAAKCAVAYTQAGDSGKEFPYFEEEVVSKVGLKQHRVTNERMRDKYIKASHGANEFQILRKSAPCLETSPCARPHGKSACAPPDSLESAIAFGVRVYAKLNLVPLRASHRMQMRAWRLKTLVTGKHERRELYSG